MKDIIYSKLQKQRDSIARFEHIMQKGKDCYSTEEFYKIESLIKILEGIREFVNKQQTLGEDSMFVKLRPQGSYPKSHTEYIVELLKQFKAFCLPSFLMKGDIYQKIFHDNLTTAKRNQVITMAKNLWAIHQTYSTKENAPLIDIDLDVLRSRIQSPSKDEEHQYNNKYAKLNTNSSSSLVKTEELKNSGYIEERK